MISLHPSRIRNTATMATMMPLLPAFLIFIFPPTNVVFFTPKTYPSTVPKAIAYYSHQLTIDDVAAVECRYLPVNVQGFCPDLFKPRFFVIGSPPSAFSVFLAGGREDCAVDLVDLPILQFSAVWGACEHGMEKSGPTV